MKRNSQQWIEVDFDDSQEKPLSSKKRKVSENDQFQNVPDLKKRNIDFFSKIIPKKTEDLAIHPKKIEELKCWLEKSTGSKTVDKYFKFLLISGPTGSGKSTTLNALCNDLGITVVEWINPVEKSLEFVPGPSQIEVFLEFLVTDSKYDSLLSTNSSKKVIVVKDFPNIFLKKSEEFQKVLEECLCRAMHPIVFVCTEEDRINFVRLLFSKEIQEQYYINHISFNPCATTLLKNAMKRAQTIIEPYSDQFSVPSANIVNNIIASCMGDIRTAMNHYYLSSLIDSPEISEVAISETKSKKKSRNIKKLDGAKSLAKDEILGLFHGLGRVLNPKTIEVNGAPKLNCDIDKLVAEFSVQSSNTLSFLFENYVKYFGSLEDLSKAADIMSFSQKFMDRWNDKYESVEISLWTTILGVMLANVNRVSKWNQIRGPVKTRRTIPAKEMWNFRTTDYFYVDHIKKKSTFQT